MIFRLVTITLLLIGCTEHPASTTCGQTGSLYRQASYPIGVALDMMELNSSAEYQTIATEQFNSITPENIFKAESIHPERGFYNWLETDSLMSYCERTQKRVHGHTLIWHVQLPEWIRSFQGTKADWELHMKEHIQTIMTRYKGKIAGWDVVNEAFNEDGTLRNSIWRQHIGDSYIEKAYRFAREADPNALLFYNDYNLEVSPTKRAAVITYFNNLRLRGVKIDGIGLQMHISIVHPGSSEIASALMDVSANEYKVHISELDISVNPLGKNITATTELLGEQANLMGAILLHYRQLPLKHRYGITFWGVSDRNSWIRSTYNRIDYPLLFDDNYQPKPMYCKAIELL